MVDEFYIEQIRLLLDILPIVARQKCFALKGGTAINLFINDFPRLSVDIDLTYLPIQSREESLNGIHQALAEISKACSKELKTIYPSLKVQNRLVDSNRLAKLFISSNRTQVKIEPNLVIRGTVYPSEVRSISKAVQEQFAVQIASPIVSIADLYGGKICAALDRQHPRDLFDVRDMYEKQGLTSQIRKAFIVYLASHDKEIHSLLNPELVDISKKFATELQGMTFRKITCEELLETRVRLIKDIHSQITIEEKRFLLSLKLGAPDWDAIGIPDIKNLPAIKWKLLNLSKIDKAKRERLVGRLKETLGL